MMAAQMMNGSTHAQRKPTGNLPTKRPKYPQRAAALHAAGEIKAFKENTAWSSQGKYDQ